jgi:hypothetical protein
VDTAPTEMVKSETTQRECLRPAERTKRRYQQWKAEFCDMCSPVTFVISKLLLVLLCDVFDGERQESGVERATSCFRRGINAVIGSPAGRLLGTVGHATGERIVAISRLPGGRRRSASNASDRSFDTGHTLL